jgi:RND family efflux transporter MFP subunit
MKLRNQTLLVCGLALVCVAAFGRLYPGAAPMMTAAGMPQTLVTLATGQGASAAKGATGEKQPQGNKQGQRPVLVATAPVTIARINASVSAIGNAEARRSVTVVPLSAGQIRAIAIKAGDSVREGDVLAELDAEAEVIERDRARLAVQNTEEKLSRTQQLANSRAASQVALSDVRTEMETARLALRDAELKLERRRILAPIGGRIGIVPVEMGDYVTTQTEIATIDDRNALRIDFWIPERYAPLVAAGMPVEASPLAMPAVVTTGSIEAVDSRIEEESRTLQVRAVIDNAADTMRPGMSFRIELKLRGEAWPAVDPLAIQWSSNGAYLWRVADGKAERVPVRVIQRNSDLVLVDARLAEGDQIVTEGVQSLRPGSPVTIAGAPSASGS